MFNQTNKTISRIFSKTAIFIVLLAFVAIPFFAHANTAPSLTGVDNESISVCEDSFDALSGVSATDADGDTVIIDVTGDDTLNDALSSNTAGSFTLSYTADDGNGGIDLVDRTITVTDDTCGGGSGGGGGGGNTAPSLLGVDDTTINICLASFDALSGVSATDADGDTVVIDVTGDDTLNDALSSNTAGSFTLSYTADDGNGGIDLVDRTITVTDDTCGGGSGGGGGGGNTAPSLTGVSSTTINICLANFDAMAGVSATDADGDTVDITVTGTNALQDALNNDIAGVYILTYTANDGNGGFDIVDRDVTVVSENCGTGGGGGGSGGGGGGGNTAPSLTGVDDITINICLASFDAMSGVSAIDADGDTTTISVIGDAAVNTALSSDTPGTFTVTYTADDGNGGFDTVDRTVTVETADCSTGGGGGGGGGGSRRGGGGGVSGGFYNPGNSPTPQVLGATTATCSYLEDFLHIDFDNDPYEVMKLQVFLRVFEGFTNLEVNGVFDQATFDAVEEFQIAYNDNVLNPWGYEDTGSTGYVYILTKRMVNQIFCDTFIALTPEQEQEISAYRDMFNSSGASLSGDVLGDSIDEDSEDTNDELLLIIKDSDEGTQIYSYIGGVFSTFYSGVTSIGNFIFSTCFVLFLLGLILGWLMMEWYKGQKEDKGHI